MAILPPLLLTGALVAGQLGAMPLSFEQRSADRFTSSLGGSVVTIEPAKVTFGSLTLHFIGASPEARLAGVGKSAPSTYFGSGFHQTFGQFPRLALRQVYPGIDATFYGNGDHLEYDLILQPGASPRVLRISFEGSRRLRIDSRGDLVVESGTEVLRQKLPRVFQPDGKTVEVHYALLSGHSVAIRVGRYDARLPLTVDPEVVYTSTFASVTGGAGSSALATDSQGNIYVAGHASAANFPATQAPQSRIAASLMAFSTTGPTITPLTVGRAAGVMAIGGAPDSSRLYGATPGAIYSSSDGGASWSPCSALPVLNPQAAPVIANISADAADPSRVFLSTNQGVIFSGDGCQTWEFRNTGLPVRDDGSTSVASIVVSAANPAVVYALSGALSLNSLYQSTDGGATWQAVTSIDPAFGAVTAIALNGSDLYAATQSGALFKSSDGGATWMALGSGLGSVRTLLIDLAGNIHVLTASGILRSTDGGLNFVPSSFTSTTGATAQQIAVDASGALYVGALQAGATWVYMSTDQDSWKSLALTPNLHTLIALGDRVYAGFDAAPATFVVKLDPTGSQILYSTFLGGSYVTVNSLQVDALGNCTIAGTASASDFPAMAQIGKTSPVTAWSAFVTRLTADGTQLLYSTLIGGSAGVTLGGMAVDSLGAIYLAGSTPSPDFPTTPHSFQQSAPTTPCIRVSNPNLSPLIPGPGGNAFVAKLREDGTGFAWSTFLTGSCGSGAYGIAVDSAGEVVVSGQTASSDFPVSPAAYQSTGPSGDAGANSPVNSGFVTKLSATGDRVIASSFINGGQATQASAVAVDPAGNVALTGFRLGPGPGGTAGAYQFLSSGECFYVPTSTFHFPYINYDAFVLKLDPALSSATFLSYLSGNCSDQGTGVAMDPLGNVWVTGVTSSVDFPLKAPYQEFGPSGSFLSEISSDGSQLLFSSATDGTALLSDPSGAVYLAGSQFNPLISQASQLEVIKLDPATPPVIIDDLTPVTASPQAVFTAPNSYRSIAAGELVRISGRSFGPPAEIDAQPDSGRFPFSLGGVTVSFDGLPAPLVSVQDTEIVCLSPFEISQSTQITVDSNGQRSNSVRMSVIASAPQILGISNADGTPNTAGNPAQPGSMLTIYASGMGQTVPPSVDGAVNDSTQPSPLTRFGVYVQGTLVPVQSVGAATGMAAGIMQINVKLPASADLPGKLSISVNNFTSSTVNANYSMSYCYIAE